MPKNNTQEYRANLREELAAFQNDLCFFCDRPLLFEHPDVNHDDLASFDHFVSRFNGGSNDKSNLVIAHRGCNSKLHHHNKPKRFMAKLEKLNEKRGYGEQVMGDALTRPSIATEDFLERLGSIEGREGELLRKKIARMFQNFHIGINDFKRMQSPELRYRMARLWIDGLIANIKIDQQLTGIPIKNYLRNIFITHAKVTLLREKTILK